MFRGRFSWSLNSSALCANCWPSRSKCLSVSAVAVASEQFSRSIVKLPITRTPSLTRTFKRTSLNSPAISAFFLTIISTDQNPIAADSLHPKNHRLLKDLKSSQWSSGSASSLSRTVDLSAERSERPLPADTSKVLKTLLKMCNCGKMLHGPPNPTSASFTPSRLGARVWNWF